MNFQNDLQSWLSHYSCPAFSVKENIITACNQAAEALLLSIGMDIRELLLTGAEEYSQFQIKTATGKGSIFFCTGYQQFPHIHTGTQQIAFRTLVAGCDDILFYGKCGAGAAMQPTRQIISNFHDAPPCA